MHDVCRVISFEGDHELLISQANTIHSFGLGDQEFVVAFEADDPADIVHMVEDLRAAEVRLYTAIDTPIFLGFRKSLLEALEDLG